VFWRGQRKRAGKSRSARANLTRPLLEHMMPARSDTEQSRSQPWRALYPRSAAAPIIRYSQGPAMGDLRSPADGRSVALQERYRTGASSVCRACPNHDPGRWLRGVSGGPEYGHGETELQ